MVSFWLKPFKPPATFKSFPIYLFLKDVTLLIEDLHSLCLLGVNKAKLHNPIMNTSSIISSQNIVLTKYMIWSKQCHVLVLVLQQMSKYLYLLMYFLMHFTPCLHKPTLSAFDSYRNCL